MEELFVYSLLYDVGYEKVNEYEETLNRLFLNNPEDRNLLDLEEMTFKDAMFHLRHLINVLSFDTMEFGKQLMSKIKPLYDGNNIADFGKAMYRLWTLLPEKIKLEEPFYILSYADDCLGYGNEKQCQELYENALNYYDQ